MLKAIFRNTILALIIISILCMYSVIKDKTTLASNPPQKTEESIKREVILVPIIQNYNMSEEDKKILEIHTEKTDKVNAIKSYLQNNKASEELINLAPILVELCYLYDIDPFRPISIIIHETGFGKSNAFREKNNVAGLNWTTAQKKKIGINSNVYNLAVEKTLEASVTNLILLLVKYKNFEKPLITLTEIKTKYAPNTDKRNGLDGVTNNHWARDTIKHYRNIEALYLNKKQSRRC